MADYIEPSAPSVEPDSKSSKTDKQPSGRLRKYWREIEAYNKAAEDWHGQAEKIVKMYLDQHRPVSTSQRRFALLWSNIETLKPAVYAKTPNILCSRRHKDPDPIGRVAAEILERATNTTLDLYKADERFRMVRDDRLLVSRGTAWVRYEADTTGEKINYEKTCIDYVHWKDFGHSVAGTWADVWLIWRKVYKTRQENRERFGKEIADKLTYSAKTAADDDKEMGEHKACVYEVWDKTRKKVCFISKDCPDILEDGDPPTNFGDFFPCPEPCYGSKTSKSLFPTPDYRYYQDQAQEIDDLTQQIASITDLLSPKGFVPSGPSGDGADAVRILIQSLQSQITQNKTIFIPVEAWGAFAEKGGAKGLIEWMPVRDFVDTLKGAIEARNQLVQDVYQITGIADILRGETDPNETLGAQQLKAQTGARRIKNAKDEVARFCRDIGQLVAEVIAEQFQPQTLADISGFAYVPVPPPPMMPGMAPSMAPGMERQSPSGKTFDDKVLQLLRDDRMRGFLIDIETDSTIQPDEDAEKQRRTEFVTSVGGYISQIGPMMQQAPELGPMVAEMLLFAVRGFRVGRQMEDVIETTIKNVGQSLQQKQGQPDPKVQAEQAKMQMEQGKMQAQMQLEQQKMQLERERMAMELQFKQAELELAKQEAVTKMQLEQQKAEHDAKLKDLELQHDLQIKQQEAAMNAEIAAQEAHQNIQTKQAEAQANMQMMHEHHGMKREMEQAKFGDERNMKAQAFQTEQKQKSIAFEKQEERNEKSSRAETEAKLEIMKGRAAAEAREPKPKTSKRIVVRKRGDDGKPAEYEIN